MQVAAYEKVVKLKKAYELRCKEVDKIDEEVCYPIYTAAVSALYCRH